jgi:hypothetical protein
MTIGIFGHEATNFMSVFYANSEPQPNAKVFVWGERRDSEIKPAKRVLSRS